MSIIGRPQINSSTSSGANTAKIDLGIKKWNPVRKHFSYNLIYSAIL